MRIQIVAAVALAASLFAVAPSSAKTDKPPTVPATVALAWNANAVAAVRAASVIDPQGTAARPLYQTEGLLYMSYVQARSMTRRRRSVTATCPTIASPQRPATPHSQAAVIAAAYNTLVFYLGDPGGTLAAKYAASIAALPDDRTTARGIAVGQAAAADIEALARTTDATRRSQRRSALARFSPACGSGRRRPPCRLRRRRGWR
jgi:hypothetical protein